MKEYKFKIHGNEYEVSINSVEDNIADVTEIFHHARNRKTGI